jgi:D-sedoheptulose 7-phosphate isomerase
VIRLIKNNGLSVRVISLNANMSLITAVAESEGYDRVFSWQIENMASGSDMLIAISGSGNSPNILEAVASARN